MRLLQTIVALAGAGLLVAALLGYGGPILYELDLLAHFRLHILALSGMVALASLAAGSRSGLWRSSAAAVLAVAGLAPLWEGPGPAVGGLPITVMAANVYAENAHPEQMLQALAAADADILITIETTLAAFPESSSLAEIYPYRVGYHTNRPNLGAVVWSRYPVLWSGQLPDESDLPTGVRAVVEIAPGRTLSVLGLHLGHVSLGNQSTQVEALDEMTAGLPQPLVVMGDFNATAWSWGLRRAQELTGTRRIGGLLRTWDGSYPTPFWPLPEPFGLPIDHIMVSDGLGVERIGTVDIPGSDHDAVRAVLRVP